MTGKSRDHAVRLRGPASSGGAAYLMATSRVMGTKCGSPCGPVTVPAGALETR
jgi:hypothetical protein